MTGSLSALVLATIAFVGGHFLLSWPALRQRLAGALREGPFLGVYSLVMAACLAWMIYAYRAAPVVGLWDLGPAGRHVPLVVMPFALMLAVLGLATRNPTAVGAESAVSAAPRAIVTVTRHPFLCGAALWAFAHLAANGDAASLVLFGGIAVLSIGGMFAIDHKRAAKLGDAWQPFARATSRLPFAAAASGRTRIDWTGIGWLRPLAALAIYALLLFSHTWLFGVSALPGG